jgi:hypothetical protein
MKQYKNISDIQNAIKSISAEYYTVQDLNLLTGQFAYNNDIKFPVNLPNKNRLELHLYGGDTWITGNHAVTPLPQLPQFIDSRTEYSSHFLIS